MRLLAGNTKLCLKLILHLLPLKFGHSPCTLTGMFLHDEVSHNRRAHIAKDMAQESKSARQLACLANPDEPVKMPILFQKSDPQEHATDVSGESYWLQVHVHQD